MDRSSLAKAFAILEHRAELIDLNRSDYNAQQTSDLLILPR